MDVVAAPPAAAEPAPAAEAKPTAVRHANPKPVKPAEKPHDSNVTTAIIATVIIVLGLGLMAVFAYLKQTRSL